MNLKDFDPRSFALMTQVENYLLIVGGEINQSKLSSGIILDMSEKKRISTFESGFGFSCNGN